MKKGKGLARRRVWFVLAIALVGSALAWGAYHHRFATLSRATEDLARRFPAVKAPKDLRGVIHVHTAIGGNSPGTLDDVVQAARSAKIDFVILTEHATPYGNQWQPGSQAGKRPILIFGEEREEETRRVLVVPRADHGVTLRIAAHWMAAPQEAVMEIVNLHEEAEASPRWRAVLALAGSLPGYSRWSLLPVQRVFREKLEIWDDILRQRRIWVVGGNDAHANIGLRLEYASGRPIFDWTLDPYQSSFGYLNTHVWVDQDEPGPEPVLDALASGESYVSFDFMHDPTGFSFTAPGSASRNAVEGASLAIVSPVPARIRLLRDGGTFREEDGVTRMDVSGAVAGVYRAELYLPALGGWAAANPWIISNPIFVTPR